MLNAHENVVHFDDKLYITKELAAALIGCTPKAWYVTHHRDPNPRVQYVKNPYQRGKVYDLDGTLDTIVASKEGDVRWRKRGKGLSVRSSTFIDVRSLILGYYEDDDFPLISKYTRDQVDSILKAFTPEHEDKPLNLDVSAPEETKVPVTSTPIPATPDSTFAMASNHEAEGVEYIFIGEDEPSLRTGLTQVFGETENFERPDDYDRLFGFVEKTCFGFLDESNDECMKKCRMQGPCAEKRNEILSDFSKTAEEEDALTVKRIALKKDLARFSERKKRVRADVSNWL